MCGLRRDWPSNRQTPTSLAGECIRRLAKECVVTANIKAEN
jgi:hypothetical protein